MRGGVSTSPFLLNLLMALIQGKLREELTAETILKKITEYDIYRMYLGRDFQLGTTIKSPFRKETNPSFFMGNKGGFIHHKDLADKRWSGNCFHFVQQMFNLSYGEALQRIDHDFGLGIAGIEKDWKSTVTKYEQPPKIERSSLIQVVQRPFDPTELAYWKQFHIDLKDLKEENIYAIKKLYYNKTQWALKKTDLVFGYLYGDRWKIYWPLKNKKDKWMPNNVPNDTMDGLENLQGCDIGIITKSKKDKIVSKKFLTSCSAHCQNESNAAINDENIQYIQKNVKQAYVIFDNDKPGVEACMYYNQFGFKYWNVPQKYRTEGIKDLAEFVQHYGPEALRAEVGKRIRL